MEFEKLLKSTIRDIEIMVGDLVADAIQNYIDSVQFGEDACEYCRKQGWKEPD